MKKKQKLIVLAGNNFFRHLIKETNVLTIRSKYQETGASQAIYYLLILCFSMFIKDYKNLKLTFLMIVIHLQDSLLIYSLKTNFSVSSFFYFYSLFYFISFDLFRVCVCQCARASHEVLQRWYKEEEIVAGFSFSLSGAVWRCNNSSRYF